MLEDLEEEEEAGYTETVFEECFFAVPTWAAGGVPEELLKEAWVRPKRLSSVDCCWLR